MQESSLFSEIQGEFRINKGKEIVKKKQIKFKTNIFYFLFFIIFIFIYYSSTSSFFSV